MNTRLGLAALTMTLFSAPMVQAAQCSVDGDYDIEISDQALRFERESGDPALVEFRQGELWIDGQLQSLSAADQERVSRIEQDVRAMVPEVKAIAMEAIDIAGVALEQVVVAMASESDRQQIIDRGNQLRNQLRNKIDDANSTRSIDEEEFELAIGEMIESVVPELVGSVTAMAVQAAMSGDMTLASEIEAKAELLERTIEEQVEARADLIETRADALCDRLRDLDRIEAQLDFAMADGKTLNLFQVD